MNLSLNTTVAVPQSSTPEPQPPTPRKPTPPQHALPQPPQKKPAQNPEETPAIEKKEQELQKPLPAIFEKALPIKKTQHAAKPLPPKPQEKNKAQEEQIVVLPESQPAQTYVLPKVDQPTPQPVQQQTSGLPSGWEQAVDPVSGIPYYINIYAKSSQWDIPTEPAIAGEKLFFFKVIMSSYRSYCC